MQIPFDEDSYREGRAAFDAGASIRDIVMQCVERGDADDVKVMCGAIGFADALIDRIRAIPQQPLRLR